MNSKLNVNRSTRGRKELFFTNQMTGSLFSNPIAGSPNRAQSKFWCSIKVSLANWIFNRYSYRYRIPRSIHACHFLHSANLQLSSRQLRFQQAARIDRKLNHEASRKLLNPWVFSWVVQAPYSRPVPPYYIPVPRPPPLAPIYLSTWATRTDPVDFFVSHHRDRQLALLLIPP